MKKLQEDCPVFITEIPDLIMKDIDVWVDESKKIKNHPLAELRAVENAGYLAEDGIRHNSYQSVIPSNLIENSYWLPWVLKLAAKNWEGHHLNYSLVRSPGHFHGYDVWTNFSYEGDDNPSHEHSGFISGVIYYKNHDHATYFDDYDIKYDGYDGTMIMFPSNVRHHVKEQLLDEERITIAFNIGAIFKLKNSSDSNFNYQ